MQISIWQLQKNSSASKIFYYICLEIITIKNLKDPLRKVDLKIGLNRGANYRKEYYLQYWTIRFLHVIIIFSSHTWLP